MVPSAWPCLVGAGVIRSHLTALPSTSPGRAVLISLCLGSTYQWQKQRWQCLSFLVVQLFASQTEGRMSVYELSDYFSAEFVGHFRKRRVLLLGHVIAARCRGRGEPKRRIGGLKSESSGTGTYKKTHHPTPLDH